MDIETRDKIIMGLWGRSSHGTDRITVEDIYKVGRESMRQEIIPIVYGMCESDNVAARTVEAIRKIEA